MGKVREDEKSLRGVEKCWVRRGKVCWGVGKVREETGGCEKVCWMLECGGGRGDVEKCGKVCWVWGSVGEVWESGESPCRDVGGVGRVWEVYGG